MIKKHSVKISQHITSISLEDEFWIELKNIAARKKITLNSLIAQIDEKRSSNNLCSAIRIFVLQEVKNNNSIIL